MLLWQQKQVIRTSRRISITIVSKIKKGEHFLAENTSPFHPKEAFTSPV